MTDLTPEKRDLIGATFLVATATAAAADLSGADVLIDSHPTADETLLVSPTDLDQIAGSLPDELDTVFTGDDYLVVEEHDGTWAGGVGRDVVGTGDRTVTPNGDRTRKIRDRLTTGNLAGGAAVILALIVLGWTAIKRRMR